MATCNPVFQFQIFTLKVSIFLLLLIKNNWHNAQWMLLNCFQAETFMNTTRKAQILSAYQIQLQPAPLKCIGPTPFSYP